MGEVGYCRFHDEMELFIWAYFSGIKLPVAAQQSQTIGLESGLILAEERIDYSYKFRKTPTLAIESVLLKEGNGFVVANCSVIYLLLTNNSNLFKLVWR